MVAVLREGGRRRLTENENTIASLCLDAYLHEYLLLLACSYYYYLLSLQWCVHMKGVQPPRRFFFLLWYKNGKCVYKT